MKPSLAVPLFVGFSIATGVAGYWLGSLSEVKITQVRDSSSQAAALLALEPELNSADPNVREHALWLKLGELRALEWKPTQLMSGDIAAMEVAITYAKLAQLHPALGAPGRSELLMKHAVSACAKAASPNCNAEALSLIARRLSASTGAK
jgi:hypothetical protein